MEGLTLLALGCHRLCVHRLLKWPLLESPGILSACKLVPALRLRNPFTSIQRLQPRPLKAVHFHCRAIIVTHRWILVCTENLIRVDEAMESPKLAE
jgi:hypothetical protein